MTTMRPLLACFITYSLLGISKALENDFSSYPSGSQNCLYSSADSSGCSGNTGAELNSCLCSNQGNFIYSTAKCVAKASPSDLDTVYATLQNNCAGTGSTISVSHDAFMAQAAAATTTTSSATSTKTDIQTSTASDTPSDTSSPTNDSTSSDSISNTGLSTGAKIGIGAGIGLGAIALGLAAAFVWLYGRRRKNTNEDFTQATSAPEYSGTYGQPAQIDGTELNQWKPLVSSLGPSPVGGYYGAQNEKANAGAGQPLLAELGGAGLQRSELYAELPVELPADSHLHGPSEQTVYDAEMLSQYNSQYPTTTGGQEPDSSQYSPSDYTRSPY